MNRQRFVVFRADHGTLAALPVDCVLETMRPLEIEAIAGAPSFVLGAAVVRGRATPVIDAAELFGSTAEASRWIAIRVGGRDVVLAVHSVVGVQALDLAGAAPPPLLARAARAAISELAALDGELLAVLDAGRLLPELTDAR